MKYYSKKIKYRKPITGIFCILKKIMIDNSFFIVTKQHPFSKLNFLTFNFIHLTPKVHDIYKQKKVINNVGESGEKW